MRTLVIALCLPFLAAAGCATTDTRVARTDCKIAPITTASVAGKAKRVDPLERRMAEMHLAGTDYRRRNLDRGPYDGLVEESLQDCY